jgi:hypothetical protein
MFSLIRLFEITNQPFHTPLLLIRPHLKAVSFSGNKRLRIAAAGNVRQLPSIQRTANLMLSVLQSGGYKVAPGVSPPRFERRTGAEIVERLVRTGKLTLERGCAETQPPLFGENE